MVPSLFSLPADSRVAQTIESFGDNGQPVPMTPEAFAIPVQDLSTTRATPAGVVDLLRLSRRLYVHGFFVYDFVTVGVHYSLMALEAALRHRLEARPKETLQRMIDKALAQHLLDAADHERLRRIGSWPSFFPMRPKADDSRRGRSQSLTWGRRQRRAVGSAGWPP